MKIGDLVMCMHDVPVINAIAGYTYTVQDTAMNGVFIKINKDSPYLISEDYFVLVKSTITLNKHTRIV